MRIEMHNTQYVPHGFYWIPSVFSSPPDSGESTTQIPCYPSAVTILYVYSFPFTPEPVTAYVNTVICINKTIPFAYIHLLDTE